MGDMLDMSWWQSEPLHQKRLNKGHNLSSKPQAGKKLSQEPRKAHFTRKKSLLPRPYHRFDFRVFGEEQVSQDCTNMIVAA